MFKVFLIPNIRIDLREWPAVTILCSDVSKTVRIVYDGN